MAHPADTWIEIEDVRRRYPFLAETLENLADDNDSWILGTPVFETDGDDVLGMPLEATDPTEYAHRHGLAEGWRTPERVRLSELEDEAASLTPDERVELACGGDDGGAISSWHVVRAKAVYLLDVFLAECFDGSLARQFRGENVS